MSHRMTETTSPCHLGTWETGHPQENLEITWEVENWLQLWMQPSRTWQKVESESEVAQSCLTLCDPMDCSLPGSSVHGILQARVLEWVAIFFSRGSSRPRERTQVSCIPGRRFNRWATREGRKPYRFNVFEQHFCPRHWLVTKLCSQ